VIPLRDSRGYVLGHLTPIAARQVATELRAELAAMAPTSAEARELTATLCHLRTELQEYDERTARAEGERQRARERLRRLVDEGVVWGVGPCGERVPPMGVL
jgi:predicted nuclease with TOPRIM domain